MAALADDDNRQGSRVNSGKNPLENAEFAFHSIVNTDEMRKQAS
jgi:hypothetical protein